MADLQAVLAAVDKLTPEELDQVAQRIAQRREAMGRERPAWWIVPPESLEKIDKVMRPVQEEASRMTEEEVTEVIDQAIAEVRRERKTRRGR